MKSFYPYIICGLFGLLSACAPAPKSVDEMISDAVRDQPETPVETKPEEMTAEDYISLASDSSGKQREQHLLMAAELMYQRGDLREAKGQLQHLDTATVALSRQNQINLLASKIALANENPKQALELIPELNTLPREQFIEANKIRANANLTLGYPLEAVRIRAALNGYLESPEMIDQNNEAIWAALLRTPTLSLKASSKDSTYVRGWIDLARVMRDSQTDISTMQNNVLDWGVRHPNHPVSNVFIDKLLDQYQQSYTPAASIAIMLPMQGKYKGVADAIQGGILSAWYQDTSAEKPQLRFYDTSNENLSFNELYQQAVADGASYIIGPLDKASINGLAQQHELELPILTLNNSENPLSNTVNLYQFGLLPEDEAIQAAELAIRDNHTRAAVLVPNSDWGRRLLAAFKQRFEKLGGTVLTVEHYPTNVDDYSRQLRRLFNLDESEARHRDLQHILGTKLDFMPHRRQDIDMIFLAATHRAARGIIPALKFHHAGDLPVYATSHVYSGHLDRSADRDLDGVLFCDLPWTLISKNELKKDFDSSWEDQRTYTRLFALGIDAFNLVQNLKYLQTHEYARFSGETGNISMDENQRLHRELLWAKFRNGTPVYIDLTILPKKQTNNAAKQS